MTPTGAVVDTPIDEVTLPGSEGEFGVLPSHQPALVMLGGGTVSFRGPSGSGEVFVQGGVVEVRPDSILVLTDRALLPADVDLADAQARLRQMEQAIDDGGILDDATIRRRAAERGYLEAVTAAKA